MSARFQAGEAVRVRWAIPPGHIRTPYYARGKEGVVERICGEFANPEELAQGRDGLPRRPLYRVRFKQHSLWRDYAEGENDCVEIEIYEHWLEPAS